MTVAGPADAGVNDTPHEAAGPSVQLSVTVPFVVLHVTAPVGVDGSVAASVTVAVHERAMPAVASSHATTVEVA